MARIRYIKPDFFKDEDIKELPYEARLFFIGLWCFADKEGRLEDRPERLKVEIMPYDDIDIKKILDLLSQPKKNSKIPFIQRYEKNSQKYIQILRWKEHQRPHHTEVESTLPLLTVKKRLRNGYALLEKEKGMEKGMEKNNILLDLFNSFWSAYPKKVNKDYTIKCWNKLKPTPELANVIISTIEKAKESKEWKKDNGQFIPHPSTYLNNRRWEDEGVKMEASKYDKYD